MGSIINQQNRKIKFLIILLFLSMGAPSLQASFIKGVAGEEDESSEERFRSTLIEGEVKHKLSRYKSPVVRDFVSKIIQNPHCKTLFLDGLLFTSISMNTPGRPQAKKEDVLDMGGIPYKIFTKFVPHAISYGIFSDASRIDITADFKKFLLEEERKRLRCNYERINEKIELWTSSLLLSKDPPAQGYSPKPQTEIANLVKILSYLRRIRDGKLKASYSYEMNAPDLNVLLKKTREALYEIKWLYTSAMHLAADVCKANDEKTICAAIKSFATQIQLPASFENYLIKLFWARQNFLKHKINVITFANNQAVEEILKAIINRDVFYNIPSGFEHLLLLNNITEDFHPIEGVIRLQNLHK